MAKIGKLSPKMEELMLNLMKEGGMEDEKDDKPKKKPTGKKRPGKPVGKFAAVPTSRAKDSSETSARVAKTWTACSYIWVLERPFMDDTGCVKWEFLSACVGEKADFAQEVITPACRKRKVVVYGVPLPKDNVTPTKEEADGISKQKQFEFDSIAGGSSEQSVKDGGEGEV